MQAAEPPKATIGLFLESKQLVPTTARTYKGTLEQVERLVGKPLADCTTFDMAKVKKEFEKGSNRTPVTKWQRIRSFYKWALETGCMKGDAKTREGDPTKGIELAERHDPKKPTLNTGDLEKILAYWKNEREKAARKSIRKELQKLSDAEKKPRDLYRITWLLYYKGMRGGELLPEKDTERKTVCDESGPEQCQKRPIPHDFKFLQDGRLCWVRIKGEPRKIRFKRMVLTEEELAWLRAVIKEPPFVLHTYDYHLKTMQASQEIVLVNRDGSPAPGAPLTSHTFRRTAARAFGKKKVPHLMANPYFGWTPNSHQYDTYGEQEPEDLDAVARDALGLEKRKKKAGPLPSEG